MTRQRDYRERDYDYDNHSTYRERISSNRPPVRRNEQDDYYYEYGDRHHYQNRPPTRPPRARGADRPPRPVERHSPARRSPDWNEPPLSHYRNPRSPHDYYERNMNQAPSRPHSPRPPGTPYPSAQSLRQAKQTTNRKIFLFVYNLLFYVITIGILLSSVMFAFSEKSDASIMGYRFYQVLTNSMAPQADSAKGGFYAGDIVIVKLVNSDQVKKGDIVTFQVGDSDRYLTHRMVDRLDELNGEKGDYIVTKGDANNTNDPPIKAERIYGKVTFVIPKMGGVLNFIQENLWLCLVCVLSTFGFLLVLKTYFLQPELIRQSNRRTSYPTRL